MQHFDHTYTLGLNVYEGTYEPFQTDGGGLFFCTLPQILRWLRLYEDPKFICRVELTPESRVTQFRDKFKTDRFILSDPADVSGFLRANFTVWQILDADPYNIRFLNSRLPVLAFYAVMKEPYTLQFIEEPCYDLILHAIRQNGMAAQFVPNIGEELALIAVKQTPRALSVLKRPTEAVCIEACSRDGHMLTFVQNQTHAICEAAVRQNGRALQYVKEQTAQLATIAVRTTPAASRYVSPELMELVFKRPQFVLH